jgi:hypothetical protein
MTKSPVSDVNPESAEGRLSPLALLWYVNPPKKEISNLFPAIIRLFRGENPIVVCYPHPLQPNSFYFAAKAGSGMVSHGHLDAGSFILEKNGVRWALDLGMHDYHSLESKGLDLWQKGPNGARWTVLRYTNFSHSTLSVNGLLHKEEGAADFFQFVPNAPAVTGKTSQWATGFRASLNMTGPLSSAPIKEATRIFTVDTEKESVVIEDTLSGLPKDASVCWGMTTRARTEGNQSDKILHLSQGGKSITLTIEEGGEESVWSSADLSLPPDPREDKNPGVWRAYFNTKADKNGDVKIKVSIV